MARASESNTAAAFSFTCCAATLCGETKSVRFEELGLIHLRYLKGLPVPCCVASRKYDRYVQERLDLEPLAEDDYYREVEA